MLQKEQGQNVTRQGYGAWVSPRPSVGNTSRAGDDTSGALVTDYDVAARTIDHENFLLTLSERSEHTLPLFPATAFGSRADN